MATQPTITRSHLDDRVRGRVIVPGDDDYDERRTVFLGGIDRRPAAIVMAADADDVARTVDVRQRDRRSNSRCGAADTAARDTARPTAASCSTCETSSARDRCRCAHGVGGNRA